MWLGGGADDRFRNIVFSDPGMLPKYVFDNWYK